MNMKKIIRIFTIGLLAGLLACEDVDTLTPVPSTDPSTFTAKFLLVNATPDGPALDLYINNIKVGNSVEPGEGQSAFSIVPITSNAVIANTNIRSRASTGTIGGVLGTSDLIYRASSTNTNNFTAANNGQYTLIVVDSINRPKPLRTLNSLNVGDVTYYSSKPTFTAPKIVGVGDTTIYLNVATFGVDDNPSDAYASNNSIVAFNLVKKYNGNVAPTFMTPIGIVPLGSSDVGGVRYYLWQDVFPAFTNASDSVNKAGFRVVNASPNAPGLKFRLKGAATLNLNGGNAASYIMSNAGGLTPSVGSRTATSATANFTTLTIATAGTPDTYDIEVSADNFATVFKEIGVTFGGSTNTASSYTIVVSGLYNSDIANSDLKITVVENN